MVLVAVGPFSGAVGHSGGCSFFFHTLLFVKDETGTPEASCLIAVLLRCLVLPIAFFLRLAYPFGVLSS